MGSELLLLTTAAGPDDVLPGLALLPHRVHTVPPDPANLLAAPPRDAVILDARDDLAAARDLCRMLATDSTPVMAVVTEGGLIAVTPEWGMADLILPTAGPAEVDARLRLLAARGGAEAGETEPVLTAGELTIEETTYTARLRGKALELTYKEFELLKYLVQHGGRVFTRAQLLQEVWGYDFFGGTRTVDVHVRRLRAKLGPEHDSMIGTVRNVGYKFVGPTKGKTTKSAEPVAEPAAAAHAADVALTPIQR